MKKASSGNRFHLVGMLVSLTLLTGCVTTQGSAGAGLREAGFGGLSDAFSGEMREFKRLVADGKPSEAYFYYIEKATYFEKRFAGLELPAEFRQVAEFAWTIRYKEKAESALQSLKGVTTIEEPSGWAKTSNSLLTAVNLADAVKGDELMKISRVGSTETTEILEEVKRVYALAEQQKSAALLKVSGRLFALERGPFPYVAPTSFGPEDFKASEPFQALAVKNFLATNQQSDYLKLAIHIGPYLSTASKEAIDAAFASFIRKEIVADGRVTLDEVSRLGSAKTPFGGGRESINALATIGYVDLTAASFKNRNIFDFEIGFNNDLDFKFAPATEAIFTNNDLSRFDFVFVTDLAVAKVARDFKTNKEIKSRFQSGTRQVHNPNYVIAMTNYQRAMADMQSTQFNSSRPKPCAGFGCLLIGIADGLAVSNTRNRVEQASAELASTPQTTDAAVYSEYTYRTVDISGVKTADVNYYVIDVRGKRILKSSFQITDNESFSVAYNVRDDDPDKSSIARNVKTEDEVTAWEKRPMTVSLSALFNPENFSRTEQTTFKDVPAFLATLSNRSYAAASPTYKSNSSSLSSKTSLASEAKPSSSSSTADTIADERYDSILIIRNGKGMGTGFYVTPDLVLTAYHVVEGSNLIEMTYYDGTKTYGRVIDHDVRLDLALVRPQQAGKPLSIHSGPIRLGETVEAIGHPKGYEFTITRGVISAVRKQRSANIGSNNLVEFVQTDTPISQGNSGGPLFLKGAVIGVNDWIRVDKGSQNLNFSVSYNEIRSYLDRFKGK